MSDRFGNAWNVRTKKVSTGLLTALPQFKHPALPVPIVQRRAFALVQPTAESTTVRAIDWHELGAVPPAKDQTPCNSCSSFAMTTTVEALHFIKTGKRIALCAGFIHTCLMECDCDEPADLAETVNIVCAHGIALGAEDDYPDPPTMCATRNLYPVIQRAALRDQQQAMNSLVENGPFVATMMTEPSFLRLPKGRIYRFNDAPGATLHSVSVVGFDADGQYWIIANSYGKSWCDGGIGRVAFGTDAPLGGREGWRLIV